MGGKRKRQAAERATEARRQAERVAQEKAQGEAGSNAPPPKGESAQPPVQTRVMPGTAPAKPAAKPQAERRPTWQIYRDFFRACLAAAENNRAAGVPRDLSGAMKGEVQCTYPLPLGFIPGPLVTLRFQSGQYRLGYATPEVAAQFGLKPPTEWQPLAAMSAWLREAINVHLKLIEGIGGEPSPWHFGRATKFRREGVRPEVLRLGFSQFQYPGHDIVPFGVSLVPAETAREMKVARVYNPGNLPGVPAVGTVLDKAFLDGQGPVQKLINTWIRMEDNSSWYSQHPGTPYPSQPTNHR